MVQADSWTAANAVTDGGKRCMLVYLCSNADWMLVDRIACGDNSATIRPVGKLSMSKEAIKSRHKRLKRKRAKEAARKLEEEKKAARNNAYDTEDEKEAAQEAAREGLPDPTADPMTGFYVDDNGKRRCKKQLHERDYSTPGFTHPSLIHSC
jgi:hypothetical protein